MDVSRYFFCEMRAAATRIGLRTALQQLLSSIAAKVNRAGLDYRSTISLRWIQTLFTMPRPNMIMSTKEPE